VFNAAGQKAGGEFLVNTETLGNQTTPRVAALANGRFVITWDDGSAAAPDGDGSAIRAQLFNADGSRFGAEFVVNTTTTSDQTGSAIAPLEDGGFMVVWTDTSQFAPDTSGEAIRAQRFDAEGNKVGLEIVVNSAVADAQESATIALLPDGRVFVAWQDASLSPGDPFITAIRGQILDPRDSGMTLFGSGFGDGLVGTFLADLLDGRSGDDRLWGDNGDDQIFGRGGDDTLMGGGGHDLLVGGRGKDKTFGDLGGDTFLIASIKHSTAKAKGRDAIGDFDGSEGDAIDLSDIDAKKGGDDDDFKFIDADPFSGKKGELRVVEKPNKAIVKGDVNGDGKADFAITVKGDTTLEKGDFVL
jgi:hypothetical protein